MTAQRDIIIRTNLRRKRRVSEDGTGGCDSDEEGRDDGAREGFLSRPSAVEKPQTYSS